MLACDCEAQDLGIKCLIGPLLVVVAGDTGALAMQLPASVKTVRSMLGGAVTGRSACVGPWVVFWLARGKKYE